MQSGNADADRENGEFCGRNSDCLSRYCADGKKCAPRNDSGRGGEYCHHDNHCISGKCICEHGLAGFCRRWEDWPAGQWSPTSENVMIGRCQAQRRNGYFCTNNKECYSGNCADRRKCAPEDGKGGGGEYCHHNNHCKSGRCICEPGLAGFCENWESWPEGRSSDDRRIGACSIEYGFYNGAFCSNDRQCRSKNCADEFPGLDGRCAPSDYTGVAGDYCHHDNHCESARCICDRGPAGSCEGWRWLRSGRTGHCSARFPNGANCERKENCLSNHCADGKRCAPRNDTGRPGDYCHHNDHCMSGNCSCPDGIKSLGFCKDWEAYSLLSVETLRSEASGFLCR